MDIWEDAAWWVAFFLSCEVERKPDARGRGYRPGQGLRRGMLLGLCEVERKPGRQRERISVRAGTPSGDTTKIP